MQASTTTGSPDKSAEFAKFIAELEQTAAKSPRPGAELRRCESAENLFEIATGRLPEPPPEPRVEPTGFFSLLFNLGSTSQPRTSNFDRLRKARNLFVSSNNFRRAGDSAIEIAKIIAAKPVDFYWFEFSIQSAADYYYEAGCHQLAVLCYDNAAKFFCYSGQLRCAAKCLECGAKQCVKLWRESAPRSTKFRGGGTDSSFAFETALTFYKKAAECWSDAGYVYRHENCLEQLLNLLLPANSMKEAADAFQELAFLALHHRIEKFIGYTYDAMAINANALNCCLCLICSGELQLNRKVKQLTDRCVTFKNSDELSLAMALAAAVKSRDLDALNAAVTAYERTWHWLSLSYTHPRLPNFSAMIIARLARIIRGEHTHRMLFEFDFSQSIA